MTRDSGHARPFFRVLAVLPALGGWLMVYLFVSSLESSDAAREDYWRVVAPVFVALFFSLIVVRGKIPRWFSKVSPVDFGSFDDGDDQESESETSDLPTELPAPEQKLMRLALGMTTLCLAMFCVAYFTLTTGDWKRGLPRDLALLVFPVSWLEPGWASTWAACLEVAIGTISFFLAVAMFMCLRDAHRAMRSREER